MQNYTKINNCRICYNKNLRQILDLNTQPLANNYHRGKKQEEFPLSINVCTECFHVQLSVVANPDLMFKNYLYVSGTSNTLHQYFSDFVKICEEYGVGTKRVLDIACNDGTQLDKFRENGWQTFGVDPAKNLHSISREKHNVVCGYWNDETARQFNEKFDVITAQNVFAHVHDVHDFLRLCYDNLQDSGNVFIQTSQADMILDNQFDTVYHEHLSFFNSKSMKTCANMNNFSLVDVRKTNIHGGSYVFVLKKGKHDESRSLKAIRREVDRGLYDLVTYQEYAKNCQEIVDTFRDIVADFKQNNYKIIGYGAAAKGNTFLNFSKTNLDYIVDDNDMKWGLLTPGMDTMIKNAAVLQEEDPSKIVVVPLAWNFFDEIRRKANEITNSKLTFIKYFPKVEII